MKWTSRRPLHLSGNNFLIHSKNIKKTYFEIWGNTGKSTLLCVSAVFVHASYVYRHAELFVLFLSGPALLPVNQSIDDSCQAKFNMAHKDPHRAKTMVG